MAPPKKVQMTERDVDQLAWDATALAAGWLMHGDLGTYPKLTATAKRIIKTFSDIIKEIP